MEWINLVGVFVASFIFLLVLGNSTDTVSDEEDVKALLTLCLVFAVFCTIIFV